MNARARWGISRPGVTGVESEVMPPRKPKQVSFEGIKNVQIVVTEPDFVRGVHSPEKMSLKAGGELCVGERRRCCFHVLHAGSAAHAPIYVLVETMRYSQHTLVDQKASWAEVSANLAGLGTTGKVGIMVEGGVIAV